MVVEPKDRVRDIQNKFKPDSSADPCPSKPATDFNQILIIAYYHICICLLFSTK